MRVLSIFLSLVALAGAFYCDYARAEGGSCPPGSYPIGGRGASGCAAIPGSGPGGQDDIPPMPPRANGRWYDRYGAIVQSSSTAVVGLAAGNETPQGAMAEAKKMCGSNGAADCEVVLTYSNTCAAWLVPGAEGGANTSGIAAGKTIKEAERNARQFCNDAAGRKCKTFYSACSLPKFEKF